MFFRGASRGNLWYVEASGGGTRRVATPLEGSDPSWSPLNPN